MSNECGSLNAKAKKKDWIWFKRKCLKKDCQWDNMWRTHPMMRLSEYSFLLENESVRLKKLRAGNMTPRPGMAAPSRGGTRVMRIPHDDRYLIAKETRMTLARWVQEERTRINAANSQTSQTERSKCTQLCFVVSTNIFGKWVWNPVLPFLTYHTGTGTLWRTLILIHFSLSTST